MFVSVYPFMSKHRNGERVDASDRSLEASYPQTSHISDRWGSEVWSKPQTEGRLQERSNKCSHYNRSVFWFLKHVSVKLLKYNRWWHWSSIHWQSYKTGQKQYYFHTQIYLMKIFSFHENKSQAIVNWFIMDLSFWNRKMSPLYERKVNVQLRLLIFILIANL